MGVFIYKSEINSSIAPAKMFKACILDGDNLIPKIIPQAFKSVEYIQGNGEPGSIRNVTFAQVKGVEYLEGNGGPGSIRKAALLIIRVAQRKRGYKSTAPNPLSPFHLLLNSVENHGSSGSRPRQLRVHYSVIEGNPLMNKLEKITFEVKLEVSPYGGSICKSTSK
ncbi:hypothetical protein F3Y22_tig00110548pilonHSYRG00663 [Hibiscus syriacus]|uniref:Bet v I/Major latex protein domain-containing protein n=1 Tax=Hibiscus syriacus TaxID=106335 RepID=A0A6A3AA09_HIBSY|nr:hypothetical protein F3Y22_tig00110548pilonHSYRG00663 [Hibiscus syriacus]